MQLSNIAIISSLESNSSNNWLVDHEQLTMTQYTCITTHCWITEIFKMKTHMDHLRRRRGFVIPRVSPAHSWSIVVKLKFWVWHLLSWVFCTCLIIIFDEHKSTISAGVLRVLSWLRRLNSYGQSRHKLQKTITENSIDIELNEQKQ